ncbi:MAG: class I SAM-dependent methyltransferase [Bacillota bacterium]|nr:class I SAM-dependent methyltransferase [Bacillota bacterium]
MEPPVAVTTTHQASEGAVRAARRIAERYGWPYLPREGRPLLREELGGRKGWIVVGEREARFTAADGSSFAFHPGLAVVRIKRLLAGCPDPLVKVAGLGRGDCLLDCTLGLAQDAIVAAYAVGEEGRVRGVEAVPEVAAVVEAGLQVYQYPETAVVAAMRRVEVVPAAHEAYLASLASGSWDVVYFDPMFRRAVADADGITALRRLALPLPVSRQAVAEARRIARRRVVLKERRESSEFARLGFTVVWQGRRVALGIIETSY